MSKVTKEQLIHKVYRDMEVGTKKQIKETINRFVNQIKEELSKGNTLDINEFGSFTPRTNEYSVGFPSEKSNLVTGQKINRNIITFRSYGSLKKKMNI